MMQDAQSSPTRQAIEDALTSYTPKKPAKRSAKQMLTFEKKPEKATTPPPNSTLEFENKEQCQGYAITLGLQTYLNIAEIISTYVIKIQKVLAHSVFQSAYDAGQIGADTEDGVKKLEKVFQTIARIDPQGLNKLENLQDAHQAYRQSDLATVKAQTINLVSFAQQKLHKLLSLIDLLDKDGRNTIIPALIEDMRKRIFQDFEPLMPVLIGHDRELYNAYSAQLQQCEQMIKTLEHTLAQEQTEVRQVSAATPKAIALLKAEESVAKERRRSMDIAEAADADIAQQQEKLESAETRIKALLSALDEAVKRADRAEEALASVEAQPLQTEDSHKKELIATVKELQQQLNAANLANEGLQQEIEKLTEKAKQAHAATLSVENEARQLQQKIQQLEQELQLAIATSKEFSDNNQGLFDCLTPSRRTQFNRHFGKRIAESPIRKQRSSTKKTPRSSLGTLTKIPESTPTQHDIMQDVLVAMMIYLTKLSELQIYLNTIAASCDTNEFIEHHLMMAIAYLQNEDALQKSIKRDDKFRKAYTQAKKVLEEHARQKLPEKKGFFASKAKTTLFPSPEHALTAVERAQGRLKELASVISINDEIRSMHASIQRFISLREIIASYASQIETLNFTETGVVELDQTKTQEREEQIENLKKQKAQAEKEYEELYPSICATFETFITQALLDMKHHLSYVSGHLLGPRLALARYICEKLNEIYCAKELEERHDSKEARAEIRKRTKIIDKILEGTKKEELEEQEQAILTEMGYPERTAQFIKDELRGEMQALQSGEEENDMFAVQIENDKSSKASDFLAPINENIIDALHAIFDTASAAIKEKEDDGSSQRLLSQVERVEACNKGFENAKLATMQSGANADNFVRHYFENIDRTLKTTKQANSEIYLQILTAVQVVESMFCERFVCAGFSASTTTESLNAMKAQLQTTQPFKNMNHIDKQIFMQQLKITVNNALLELVKGNLASHFLCGTYADDFYAACEAAQDEHHQAIASMVRGKALALA